MEMQCVCRAAAVQTLLLRHATHYCMAAIKLCCCSTNQYHWKLIDDGRMFLNIYSMASSTSQSGATAVWGPLKGHYICLHQIAVLPSCHPWNNLSFLKYTQTRVYCIHHQGIDCYNFIIHPSCTYQAQKNVTRREEMTSKFWSSKPHDSARLLLQKVDKKGRKRSQLLWYNCSILYHLP